MMGVSSDVRNPEAYYAQDHEASPALWDPVYEYPVPLLVRNTFFEVMARSPSFDEFMEERKVKSSPAAYEPGAEPPAPQAGHRQHAMAAAMAQSSKAHDGGRNDAYSGYGPGPGMYYGHGGEACQWLDGPPTGMPADVQFPGASSSVSFGSFAPRRHANGAALAATIAAQGAPHSREARGAPLGAQHPGRSPPWRNQMAMQGSRQYPSAPQPSELPTPSAGPGNWSSAMASGRPRPSRSGHLAAAVADEPALDEDESSSEEGEIEPHMNSELAEIGSPACPTQGSRGHSLRMCKPCAFVMKGCQSGMDCKFCHLCEVGEKKRRKKEKVAIRRELQRWRQNGSGRQTYSVSAPTTPSGGGNWRLDNFWQGS